MKIINLTPHPISIIDTDLDVVCVSFPPSGNVARIDSVQKPAGCINGISCTRNAFGDVTFTAGIPEEEAGTLYIVSAMVFNNTDRADFIQPDTSPSGVVRDEDGRIIGVKGFIVR